MGAICAQCEAFWQEYSRLAQLRLELIDEQKGSTRCSPFRTPLGERIQALAEAQIYVRKRHALHEANAHSSDDATAPVI